MTKQLFEARKGRLQSLKNLYQAERVQLDVLRLDELHPVVSGNKWFKLRPYLEAAAADGKRAILTFGGAWSNHIVATAAACRALGWPSVGVIRGEAPAVPSSALLQAQEYGMQLFFTTRADYAEKKIPEAANQLFPPGDLAIVPEGGYGLPGCRGAADILAAVDAASYTHIATAVGTGTTLAGLRLSAPSGVQVLGFPVLKGGDGGLAAAGALLPDELRNGIHLLPDAHCGGYARHTPGLLSFMNEWFGRTGLPTDFVYTGKLFFALDRLIRSGTFPGGSRILAVHSGGLQGNRSLPKGTLIF
ncbi:MAG TPA: pyridoxal-phosphate dependent enzyme [Chitinophagaceae bacterium]|jgi:1-aminocyclopropane-1-carboxylate deaminase/D-cysteine desulfhydrase-like pyridoxal-dependent ACC family enzyme|nr:pyridoxal-phosphate dependent enzyme [Chitinophagaceae bacterium]